MWLRLSEAVKYSSLSSTTLREMANRGIIRVGTTEGGHRRFDRESIDNFLKRGEIDTLAIRKALGL